MSGTAGGPAPRYWTSPLAVLGLACWFAIISGIGQIVATLVARHVLGQLITLGPNLYWMIPTALILVLGGFGILFIVVRMLAARLRNHDLWIVWCFAFLAMLNIGLLVPHMHYVAATLLAAGLASVLIRWVRGHAAWFALVVRRTTPPLLVLVAAAAVTCLGMSWWRERSAIGRLGPLARGEQPRSVLLIVLDTVRGHSSSLNGYQRRTMPELERWAARGVVFTHAIAPSAWTLPSHSTLFTGVWPDQLGVDWEIPLQPSARTLAEELETHGYLTAGFVANPTYTSRDFGLAQGFQHYDDYRLSLGEILVNAKLSRDVLNSQAVRRVWNYHDFLGRKSGQEVVEGALSWIAARDSSRPFFAFLNLFDAHEPYLPPPEYARLYPAPGTRDLGKLLQLLHEAERQDKQLMTPGEIQLERNAYEASINYADHWVGRMLDSLDRSGLLANTLVIVTSDHGEQFGEHRKFGHGNTLYRELLEVPLLVLLPGGSHGGTRVASIISLRDVPATVLDVLGLTATLPGHTLSSCWEAGSCAGSPALSALRLPDHSWARSLVADSIHFIQWQKNSMAFAWRTDEAESTDLAGTLSPGATTTAIQHAVTASLAGPGQAGAP